MIEQNEETKELNIVLDFKEFSYWNAVYDTHAWPEPNIFQI